METARYVQACMSVTLGKLRRQLWLLAGLALLCAALPLLAGQAAQQLLSRGVGMEGITLAISSPQGDGTAGQLERYMGGMEDVAQYCRIVAMEEKEAMAALEAGEVTAVLALPEGFIQGVMWGENPDLELVVAGDRPLESLLLLWVGQSASDILSAFQSGVYAVLDLYDQSPPPGLDRDQVVMDINLRYITLALDRSGMFREEEVSATGALPILPHYGLSLLAYFILSAAPLFAPVYTGSWLAFQRRLRGAGRSCLGGYAGGVVVVAGAMLVLIVPCLLACGGGRPPALAAAAAGMALFGSLFSALCCLAAQRDAGRGGLAFIVSLLSLFLAGGVVPPVLLPSAVRQLSPLSPVTWLRQLAAWPMGYEVAPLTWACLALSTAGMAVLCLALYRRRAERGEGEP